MNRIELPLLREEEAFVQAVLADPEDGPRLMYADWLEEHNDLRGEYLRLLVRLEETPVKSPERRALRSRLRELRNAIDPAWRATIARPPIERCRVQFEFECPKRWDRLKPTEDPAIRFCDSCREKVYYCPTVAEARLHARRGHCVAVDPVPVRRARDLSPRRGPPTRRMGRIRPRWLRG